MIEQVWIGTEEITIQEPYLIEEIVNAGAARRAPWRLFNRSCAS
jgi:hypothetical protein